jgi:hypothetical protein
VGGRGREVPGKLAKYVSILTEGKIQKVKVKVKVNFTV